jgi:hypothetical protein
MQRDHLVRRAGDDRGPAAAVLGVAAVVAVDVVGDGVAANETEVLFTATDRLAPVAMFAEYLDNPTGQDPQPKRYAAAAARLGWKRTTLIKRIEYLRTRLDAAGVPQMRGPGALTYLAEYAISRRLITRSDLAMLRR